MGAEANLKKLKLELGAPPAPLANYVRAVRTGDLLFLAGHGPRSIGGSRVTGKLGVNMTVEEGYACARSVGVQLLATMRQELGSLDRVARVVKLLCMVNSAPEFNRQPEVANGCSDLFVEVFGDAGRHARSAVGMADLPNGIAVEIEAVVEVHD
ncbi:MAG: RidA family protein [Chloroflexi bacterium]|nr:RidA family protein [Chloroflexota bacterium]